MYKTPDPYNFETYLFKIHHSTNLCPIIIGETCHQQVYKYYKSNVSTYIKPIFPTSASRLVISRVESERTLALHPKLAHY